MIASRDDIRQIFRLILNRDAAEPEINWWSSFAEAFGASAHELANWAVLSEEYRKGNPQMEIRLDPARFVAVAEQKALLLGSPSEVLNLPTLGPSDWWHSFTFSDGTTVRGRKSPETMRAEFDAFLGPIDFAGQTVIDIGAWNGGFSFEAKRRGAKRVLATDWFVWYPIPWPLEKLFYVRRDFGLDVEVRMIDIQDISAESVGKFNIVFFFGVFYHLREPISIIDRLADIADPWLILETYLDLQDVPYPAMRFFPGTELDKDATNWWGPNRACVEELLKTAGFSEVRFTAHPLAGRNRGVFHARK